MESLVGELSYIGLRKDLLKVKDLNYSFFLSFLDNFCQNLLLTAGCILFANFDYGTVKKTLIIKDWLRLFCLSFVIYLFGGYFKVAKTLAYLATRTFFVAFFSLYG